MKYDLDILRTANNLTMRQMANILNMSFNTYKSKKEKIINLNIEQLNKCSNYFKIPMDTLIGLSNNLEFNIISKEIDYRHLHIWLNIIRVSNRTRVQDLANILNVSRTTIFNLNKKNANLRVSILKDYCLYYHISLDFLCGKTTNKRIKK